MSKSATVDAQCLNYFQSERIRGCSEIATAAIGHILSNGHIALDEARLCYQEWLDCAQGPAELNLMDWVAERLVEKKIVFYPVRKDANLRKELIALGLPKKDHKWIYLSMESKAAALVTEDSDLYEPASKTWDATKKEKLKDEQTGCVCSFARKKLGFVIMRLCHVPEQF